MSDPNFDKDPDLDKFAPTTGQLTGRAAMWTGGLLFLVGAIGLVVGLDRPEMNMWAGLCLLTSLAMLFVAALLSLRDGVEPRRAPKSVLKGAAAEGTIVATRTMNYNGGARWRRLTVRFTTEDGQAVTADDYAPGPYGMAAQKALVVGAPVSLHYKRNKPHQMRVDLPTDTPALPAPGVTYGSSPPAASPSAATQSKQQSSPPRRAPRSVLNGVPTEGTIVATRSNGTGAARRGEMTVRFATEDGREITAVDYAPVNGWLKAGAPVSLHYNPEKPEEMRVDLPSDGHAAPQPGVLYEPDKRR